MPLMSTTRDEQSLPRLVSRLTVRMAALANGVR